MQCAKALLLLVTLLTAYPTFAKAKAKPVYDQTGKVIPSPVHHDFSASYETRDGHYYGYVCDGDAGGVDCQDSRNACRHYIQTRDGKVLSIWCNPFFQLHAGDEVSFRFTDWDFVRDRDADHRTRTPIPAICIHYFVLDKHGRPRKDKEDCSDYSVMP